MLPSHHPLTLKDLPLEIIHKIFSFLDPGDTNRLRNLILACSKTDHDGLSRLAEQILQDRRKLLLDRWRKVHAKTVIAPESPQDIESIAERLIGKEYVPKWVDVDDADEWAFKKADLNDMPKVRICMDRQYNAGSTCTQVPQETYYEYEDDPYHRGSIKGHRYSRHSDNTRLNIEVDLFGRGAGVDWGARRKPRIGVFEGVCVGVHWG